MGEKERKKEKKREKKKTIIYYFDFKRKKKLFEYLFIFWGQIELLFLLFRVIGDLCECLYELLNLLVICFVLHRVVGFSFEKQFRKREKK